MHYRIVQCTAAEECTVYSECTERLSQTVARRGITPVSPRQSGRQHPAVTQ